MKKTLVVFASMVAFSGLAHADEFCGKLTGYCGNGWCVKTITPTYCLGAILPGPHPQFPDQGANCHDGAPVKVVAENSQALEDLNNLLSKGEGTRVCADGAKDTDGVFHVSSASEEN